MGKYWGYKKYKDSGVEWLGEIPEHWKRSIFRYYFDIQLGKMLQNESRTQHDEEISYLKAIHVRWDKVDTYDLPKMWVSPREKDKYYVRNGDLLISEGGEVGRTTILKDLQEDCIIQNALHRVRSLSESSVEYLNYLMRHISDTGWLDILCNKSTIAHLTSEKVAALALPVPPLDEQEAIAHFLDHKTSQIDALIAKKEALIEKLDEKRTALISHAVTKGLDRNVPMKDSGVEWLGDIPEHWIVSKARFASSIFVPQRNKPELNSDEGLPWVTMDDMFGESIKETLFKVSDIAFKIAGSKMLRKNSVIASCIGNFGICAINDVDVIINQQLQAFIPFGTIIPEYLCEIAKISNDYFKMIATAATVVYVNQAGFANMPILLPPIKEQEEVVDYIVLRKTRIDRQKAKVKEAIALLKEYRTALITNAVTGKIDVRQEASLS